jgi:hypothetical protein
MHPIITITCAFTRRWSVDLWLKNLESVEHDPKRTNLAIVVDCGDDYILNTIKDFAKRREYRHLVYKMNEQWHPNDVRIAARRPRIAEVKNQTKDLVSQTDGEIIIGLEDDTFFEGMDLHRLIDPILQSDQVGFVEGVQCGRWDVKMIGAWRVDDVRNPYHAETLMPGQGYEEIDAGGWYGYATKRSLYLQHEYYSASSQPYGPDVNFGLWVRQQGYKCVVDWSTIFGHRDHDAILYPVGKLTAVGFDKSRVTGAWTRHDIEQQA